LFQDFKLQALSRASERSPHPHAAASSPQPSSSLAALSVLSPTAMAADCWLAELQQKSLSA